MTPPEPPTAQPPGNDSPLPPPLPPGPKTWSVGTLIYNKYTLITVFTWLLWGDLVFQIVEKVFPLAMPQQLRRIGISQFFVGIMISTLSPIISIPMNPYLSFRSDRHRSKWGRRIPYIFKTILPLALCLGALGYTDDIGAYIRSAQWVKDWHLDPTYVLIGVLAVLIMVFDYFNVFINTIYWYLFADVIPQPLMGRFTSFFRMTSFGAGMLFQWFIRQYIETDTKYIYLGAAVLYVVGFTLMCWGVREGQYPPPKDLGAKQEAATFLGKILEMFRRFIVMARVYFTECFRHPVHVSFYITTALIRVSEAVMVTGAPVYYRRYLHLTQAQMGRFDTAFIGGCILIAFPLGWVVDKIHPMRAILIAMFFVIPLSFFFGFYMDSFLIYMLWFIVRAPLNQLNAAAEQPLQISLFPRKQYGQFASANGMTRSLTMLLFSVLAAAFMNYFDQKLGPRGAGFMFTWVGIFQAVAFASMFVTYLFWRKYGASQFSYDPDLKWTDQTPARIRIAMDENILAEGESTIPDDTREPVAALPSDSPEGPVPK